MASERSYARSQKDVDYALELIHESFGPLARRVFDAVSRRESLTFEQIVGASGVQKRICGRVLYMLVKHGCVLASSNVIQTCRSKLLTTYNVDLAVTKSRTRFSRYLRYIRSRFTTEHHFIVFILLVHGSVSFEQLLIIAQHSDRKKYGQLGTQVLHQAFKELAAENLIHNGRQTHQSDVPSVNSSLTADSLRIDIAKAYRQVRGAHAEGPLDGTFQPNHFWQVNISQLERASSTETQVCEQTCRIRRAHRQKLIEAVIRSRLGCPALRIFRVLLNFQLEQKQIAELSMVPIKDTRDLLYKLLKCGYVQMQEIARTHDHAPSRTNYLWRVSYLDVESVVEKEIIQTMTNINMRLLKELKEGASASFQSQSCSLGKMNGSLDIDRNRRMKLLQLTLMRLSSVLRIFQAF